MNGAGNTRVGGSGVNGFELTDENRKLANDNLDVLRTLYVISFVLGFREIVDGIPWPYFDLSLLNPEPLCIAILLTLLGIRFFWAVGNIRHYVERSKVNDIRLIGTNIMIFHVPILLFHSFLFYALCKSFGDMFDGNGVLSPEYVLDQFFYAYVSLLVLNSVWIFTCVHPKSRSEWGTNERLKWAYNNLAFSLIVMLTISTNFDNHYEIAFILLALNSCIDLAINGRVYIFHKTG